MRVVTGLPRRSRAVAVALALLLGLGLLAPRWAGAHPMPESQVWVDTAPQGLRLSLHLPLNRLELAVGLPLAEHPAEALASHAEALRRYLLLHIGARSGGQGWVVRPPALRLAGGDGPDGTPTELVADLALQAPAGADPRQATLTIDAILHQVPTHRIQVLLRNDWAGGRAGQPPQPLGTLDFAQTRLNLALPAEASSGAAFRSLLVDGAVHIAEGADHLLFLALLMLVAPLSAVPDAQGRDRWRTGRSDRATLHHLLAVVTAFTLGHSLTLALGSLGWMQVPAGRVEVGVALTLVLAALHALRPLVARGEPALAALLGTVHGLAFSASLSGAGLGVAQHAQALLAFNLGIELAQALALAVLLPPLLWLARRPLAYARLRVAGASLGGLAALGWLVERLPEWA